MEISSLINKGFSFVNHGGDFGRPKQVVVLGVARGGTSLVAGAIQKLGVFMGERSAEPVFEDVSLSEAFESRDFSRARELIESYNRQHEIWAFKRPALVNYFDDVINLFDNPYLIFVFKDIFSVANRNAISMQSELIGDMRRVLGEYEKLVSLVESSKKPAMLVSAEKALLNRESFVDALVEKLQVGNDRREEAVSFISPNPESYLDNTRITKVAGCVDVINKQHVSGWVKALHHSNPVTVDLLCNGQKLASMAANIFRKDLKEKLVHPTGNCGFFLDLSRISLPAEPLDIEVRAEGDVAPLRNGIARFS